MLRSPAALLAAMLSVASPIAAAPITISNTTLNAGWNVGSGQSNSNFEVTRDNAFNGGSLELGLRAQQRFIGPITPVNHNYNGTPGTDMYVVQTGTSTPPGSPPRAWWNFDVSASSTSGLDNLRLDVEVLTGNLSPISSVSFDLTGNLFQDSWNPTFNFLGGPGYNLNATGIYRFTLTGTSGSSTGSVDILVNVGNVPVPVPEPSTFLVLGLAACGAAGCARRRRSKS